MGTVGSRRGLMLKAESVLLAILLDCPGSDPIRRAVTSGAAPSMLRLPTELSFHSIARLSLVQLARRMSAS
jgi:hypothetical protein